MAEVFSAPPIGTPIDFGSSLAAKLIASGNAGPSGWWHGAMKCVLTPSGGQPGSGVYGPCRSHTNTSDQLAGIAHGNSLPTGNNCTLMVVYAKRDTTNRASGLIGFNFGSGGARFGAHAPYSDGNIYWDYGGSTDGSTRLTVTGQTWVARVPSVWMYTCGPRGMECWRDGKLVGSNAGAPTRSGTGSYLFLGTHEGGGGDLDDYYTVGIWGRQLEKREIGLLSRDPWAMYQRPHSLGMLALAGAGTITSGDGSLTGAGAVAAVGTGLFPAPAALAGTGAVAATGGSTAASSSTIAAIGALSATTTSTSTATASMAGVGALAADGHADDEGAANLAGTGALTATGGSVIAGAGTLAGSGALGAVSAIVTVGAATLAGSATIAAVGTGIHSAFMAIGISDVVSGFAQAFYSSVAQLSGTLTTRIKGRARHHIGPTDPTSWADLAGYDTFDARSGSTAAAVGNLQGVGTVAAGGFAQPVAIGTAALAGTGTLAAAGLSFNAAAGALAASASLDAVGESNAASAATMAATSDLAAVSDQLTVSSAALAGSGALNAAGTAVVPGALAGMAAGALHAVGASSTASAGDLAGTSILAGSASGAIGAAGSLGGTLALVATSEGITTARATLVGAGALTVVSSALGPRIGRVLPIARTMPSTNRGPRIGVAPMRDRIGDLVDQGARVIEAPRAA